jgi:hypothetical protein
MANINFLIYVQVFQVLSDFPNKMFYVLLISPHLCYISRPSQPVLYDHLNFQMFTKLLIMQCLHLVIMISHSPFNGGNILCMLKENYKVHYVFMEFVGSESRYKWVGKNS